MPKKLHDKLAKEASAKGLKGERNDNEVGELRYEISCLRKRISTLVDALDFAVKEADGWHDDSRGGCIESAKMAKVRSLIVREKNES